MEYNIVLIGAGPRGTYGLRRLSLALAHHPPGQAVHIHVVEKSGRFGGGQIHNPAQPHYLLLNTISSQITAFGDDDEQARAAAWRKTLEGYLEKQGYDLGPNDFPPRALHGEYLAACFDWSAENLPDQVHLHRHSCEVVDIEPPFGSVHYVQLSDGTRIPAHEIALLTGHSRNRIPPGSTEESFDNFAARHNQGGASPSYLHLCYPIPEKLDYIPAQDTVYIIGMGLTATDVIKGLTYGRGGVFQGDKYIPSGQEPHIIIGSRLGVPFCARGINQKTGQYQGRIFTQDYVQNLKSQKGKLDFEKDIFPLILQEMEYVFYNTLLGEEFGKRYLTCGDLSRRQALIQEHVHPEERFNWLDLENPLWRMESERQPGHPLFESLQHYTEFVLEEMDKDLTEARKGNVASPVKNAIDSVLRDQRDVLRYAVDHAGLTAQSHRFFKKKFERTNNRVAVGPPMQSVRELQILARQGIVSFSGPVPRIEFNEGEGLFEISSPEVPGSLRKVNHIVNGRIHGVDNKNDTSQLIQNLFQRGMIRTFVNSDETGAFETGGLDVTRDFHLIAQDGRTHRNICALGIPIEGKLWFNAVDARPNVNSNTILQLSHWAQEVASRLHELDPESVAYETGTK